MALAAVWRSVAPEARGLTNWLAWAADEPAGGRQRSRLLRLCLELRRNRGFYATRSIVTLMLSMPRERLATHLRPYSVDSSSVCS